MIPTKGKPFLAVLGLALVLAAVVSIAPAEAQDLSKRKLTNQDILDMASLGLGDDVILEKIRTAPETDFVTDLESLKALKAAHVSDPVIRLMINPKAAEAPITPTAVAAAPANPFQPRNSGILLKVIGELKEETQEQVGYRTGGELTLLRMHCP